MTTPDDSPLGKVVAWPDHYDPSLLFAIARADARAELGLRASELPFVGHDLWTAYELAWLDLRGKPQAGIAQLRVPAQSPSLVESKSLKLYLNSYAGTRLGSADALCRTIATDVSNATGGAGIEVTIAAPTGTYPVHELDGECIDVLDIAIDDYGPPDPSQLVTGSTPAEEALVSHLFRSNCPVTGQPDWASVQLRYRGPRIDREGLLRYLVSFRSHNGFHEQCVERIFVEVMARCGPEALSVYARYTRRGGIDINPWRATPGYAEPVPTRCARQ